MRAASSSDDETIEHNNFKLVLLGAEAVGKTALIRQLVHNCLDARCVDRFSLTASLHNKT